MDRSGSMKSAPTAYLRSISSELSGTLIHATLRRGPRKPLRVFSRPGPDYDATLPNNAPCPAWLIVAAGASCTGGLAGQDRRGLVPRRPAQGVMGLIMEHAETIEGYEAVPLALPDQACLQGSGAAVLRRRSARPGRRAVMYVHCRGDSFAPEDLVGWYTDRGFHFYAADLREVGAEERPGADGNQAAQELGDCFACLDAAAAHVREVDAIDTMIVSAHGAGSVIAALWCHA